MHKYGLGAHIQCCIAAQHLKPLLPLEMTTRLVIVRALWRRALALRGKLSAYGFWVL